MGLKAWKTEINRKREQPEFIKCMKSLMNRFKIDVEVI